jgi:ribosomal protein L11 methyltransferase
MTEKSWQKIMIHCPNTLEEIIASLVTQQTGNGVEITVGKRSADDTTVIGYLASTDPILTDKLTAIQNHLRELARQFPEYQEPTLELAAIADEDWHRKWKESFKPFHLSNTVVIKPSWETYAPAPHEKIIEIDPGMAFGTGLHASTRLAMELLEELLADLPSPPPRTLDVGTGTGILAIGAALFGCRNITAIDIDPDAVNAARDNISANHFTGQITTSSTGLDELTGPYDLILANIIHNTLVEMAPALTRLLAPKGILIMAGILKGGQAENITAIYRKMGLTRQSIRSSAEWSALSVKKQ